MNRFIEAEDLNKMDIPNRIECLKLLAADTWSSKIMAQIAVAQAILESSILKEEISGLALQNNLFGIKGFGTKGCTNKETKEQDHDGTEFTVRATFASNRNLRDSFEQHYHLLHKPRYGSVLLAPTFDLAAHLLRKAGYATDRQYPDKLINIQRQYLGE